MAATHSKGFTRRHRHLTLQDAFSWQLWLAIVLTALAVGLVVWALERCRLMGPSHPSSEKESLPTLRHHLWTSIGRPLGVSNPALGCYPNGGPPFLSQALLGDLQA